MGAIFDSNNLPVLITGIGIGVFAVCVIWKMASAISGGKLKKQKEKREKLMSAISELIADADTMSASFRCGGMKWEMFSKGLALKVNGITRELRTNMQFFDVFFVKYVEMQTHQYITVLENPERRGQKAEEKSSPSDTGLRFTPVPDTAEAAPPPAPAAVKKAEAPVKIEEVQKSEPKPAPVTPTPVAAPVPATAAAPAVVIPVAPVKPVEKAIVKPLVDDEEEFELPAAVQSAPAPVAPAAAPAPAQTPTPAPAPAPKPAAPAAPIAAAAVPVAAPAAPVAPAAPKAPVPIVPEPEPEQDTWSEKSDEEFEAGFAHFEETGYFQITRVPEEQSSAAPKQAPPLSAMPVPPQVSAPTPPQPVITPADDDEEEEFFVGNAVSDIPDDQVLTETVCIDRIPIMGAPAVAPAAPAPAARVAPAAPAAPPQVALPAVPVPPPTAPAAPAPAAAADDGITGDDVMDSIDSFFNLK